MKPPLSEKTKFVRQPLNSSSSNGPVNATVETDYDAHGNNPKENQPNIQRKENYETIQL